MKEMVNDKRAQEMSITTLILLVLGVVVLIVIILGFTQGWGFFTDMFGKANIDSTVVVQKCGATASFGGSVCTDKIEVATDTYMTCGYAVNQVDAFEGSVEIATKCPTPATDAVKVCTQIRTSEGVKWTDTRAKKVQVNGNTCYNLNVRANCGLFDKEVSCSGNKDTCEWIVDTADSTKGTCKVSVSGTEVSNAAACAALTDDDGTKCKTKSDICIWDEKDKTCKNK